MTKNSFIADVTFKLWFSISPLNRILYIQLLLTQDGINQNDYDNFPRTKTLRVKYKSNQKYWDYQNDNSLEIGDYKRFKPMYG